MADQNPLRELAIARGAHANRTAELLAAKPEDRSSQWASALVRNVAKRFSVKGMAHNRHFTDHAELQIERST